MNKLLPYEIAHHILGEYNRYHHRFKGITKRAVIRFESRDWHGIQGDTKKRLTLYRDLVGATTEKVKEMLQGNLWDQNIWYQVKLMFAEDVMNLNTRNVAKTFYNSVFRHAHKGLSADHDLMFVTDPEQDQYQFKSVQPIYNTYNGNQTAESLVRAILKDFKFDAKYEDLKRDVNYIVQAIDQDFLSKYKVDRNTRVEVIRSVFFRNQGAYLIGRAHIDNRITPFVLPILHNENGVYFDSLITDTNDVSVIFSYNRSYFLVDIDIPSEYVEFLSTIAPTKSIGELYNSIGLVKHGKTELYRSFLSFLDITDEQFDLAPGIKGMVMTVFTMPSYNFVFKIIKDQFDYPKKSTRAKVKEKYEIVSQHDRVGRMSDTHEFEHFIVDRHHFSDHLLEELKKDAPSLLTITEDYVEIKHLYVEKKMIPLNLYLEECTAKEAEEVIDEYGLAIKQMAAVNIFPGDMLLKNFGVTRLKRVIFYDYDEIGFLTDYNFRLMPEPRDHEEEMSSGAWFSVNDNDIFPEEFSKFLIGRKEIREIFFNLHNEIFQAKYWRTVQKRIKAGEIILVYPYKKSMRFVERFRSK